MIDWSCNKFAIKNYLYLYTKHLKLAQYPNYFVFEQIRIFFEEEKTCQKIYESFCMLWKKLIWKVRDETRCLRQKLYSRVQTYCENITISLCFTSNVAIRSNVWKKFYRKVDLCRNWVELSLYISTFIAWNARTYDRTSANTWRCRPKENILTLKMTKIGFMKRFCRKKPNFVSSS